MPSFIIQILVIFNQFSLIPSSIIQILVRLDDHPMSPPPLSRSLLFSIISLISLPLFMQILDKLDDHPMSPPPLSRSFLFSIIVLILWAFFTEGCTSAKNSKWSCWVENVPKQFQRIYILIFSSSPCNLTYFFFEKFLIETILISKIRTF